MGAVSVPAGVLPEAKPATVTHHERRETRAGAAKGEAGVARWAVAAGGADLRVAEPAAAALAPTACRARRARRREPAAAASPSVASAPHSRREHSATGIAAAVLRSHARIGGLAHAAGAPAAACIGRTGTTAAASCVAATAKVERHAHGLPAAARRGAHACARAGRRAARARVARRARAAGAPVRVGATAASVRLPGSALASLGSTGAQSARRRTSTRRGRGHAEGKAKECANRFHAEPRVRVGCSLASGGRRHGSNGRNGSGASVSTSLASATERAQNRRTSPCRFAAQPRCFGSSSRRSSSPWVPAAGCPA